MGTQFCCITVDFLLKLLSSELHLNLGLKEQPGWIKPTFPWSDFPSNLKYWPPQSPCAAQVNYWLFVSNADLNYDWRYKYKLSAESAFTFNLKADKSLRHIFLPLKVIHEKGSANVRPQVSLNTTPEKRRSRLACWSLEIVFFRVTTSPKENASWSGSKAAYLMSETGQTSSINSGSPWNETPPDIFSSRVNREHYSSTNKS